MPDGHTASFRLTPHDKASQRQAWIRIADVAPWTALGRVTSKALGSCHPTTARRLLAPAPDE